MLLAALGTGMALAFGAILLHATLLPKPRLPAPPSTPPGVAGPPATPAPASGDDLLARHRARRQRATCAIDALILCTIAGAIVFVLRRDYGWDARGALRAVEGVFGAEARALKRLLSIGDGD